MVSVNVNVVFDSCMNIYEERELDNCKERKRTNTRRQQKSNSAIFSGGKVRYLLNNLNYQVQRTHNFICSIGVQREQDTCRTGKIIRQHGQQNLLIKKK